MSLNITQENPKSVNKSPLFDTPAGWSAGYSLAIGHGPGVVVGPGADNPNVFAQPFQARSGDQFKVVARASSVDTPESLGLVQVSWYGKDSKFISVSQKVFKVDSAEGTFDSTIVAPPGSKHGILYVAPGGPAAVVRYTEMTLSRLNPFGDFMSYMFLGVSGQKLLLAGSSSILLAALIFLLRRAAPRIWASLLEKIGAGLEWCFPLLALILTGGIFVFMEGNYEQHYDSQWHQASIESVMRWNDLSFDLGGNPMHNFGIQHVINPQLSPTFWIGNIVPPNHRIQIEGAFQAIILFLILVKICQFSGARLRDASAIGLIAIYFFCVPFLSDEAITLNATLGLLWQEGAIATLLAFLCFSMIGYSNKKGGGQIWPIAGLAASMLWISLAYPELIAFFTLATTGLCIGAIFGVENRRELVYKSLAAVTIVLCLLFLGYHEYVLNLFLYTPQMYYKTLYNHDFTALFFSNTSLLLASNKLGGIKIIVFFTLSAIGAVLALRFGNGFVRRVVFGGLALEATIHLLSAINVTFKLVPLTFTYVEQMGLAVIALLAGTAVWGLLLLLFRLIPKWCKVRLATSKSLASTVPNDHTVQPLPYIALLCMVAIICYQLSAQSGFYSGWPPRINSAPAKIQAQELAIEPGGYFKGRGAIIVGMENKGPASWGTDFFPILYYKHRQGLGNDLMNDAKVAGIPIVNEYGHWISPPMLALLAAAFYHPEDKIDRAAQVPRMFRPNLARLLGVSLVVSDKHLPNEEELYHGLAADHPLFISRISGANLGQYSPTVTAVATDARLVLDHLQAPGFNGEKLAVVENPLEKNLVPADRVSISFHKGPKIHLEAYSSGTSLLVLPFDYSHCLEVVGHGLDLVIPVNLAQTGLVVHGMVSLDITYRYGLIAGTKCRKLDLDRIKALNLESAATGRLFADTRPPTPQTMH